MNPSVAFARDGKGCFDGLTIARRAQHHGCGVVIQAIAAVSKAQS